MGAARPDVAVAGRTLSDGDHREFEAVEKFPFAGGVASVSFPLTKPGTPNRDIVTDFERKAVDEEIFSVTDMRAFTMVLTQKTFELGERSLAFEKISGGG